jgi:hypothetical protein
MMISTIIYNNVKISKENFLWGVGGSCPWRELSVKYKLEWKLSSSFDHAGVGCSKVG